MLPTIVHCKHFPHQRFDWLQSFDLRAFTTCNTRRKYLIAMQWKSKFEGACGSASLPASHWPLPVTDGRSKSNGLHSFCNSIKLVPKDTIYIHTVLIVKVYIVSETKSNHKQFLALHCNFSPDHPPKPNLLCPLPNLVKRLSEEGSSRVSTVSDGFGRRRLTFRLFSNVEWDFQHVPG